MLTVLTPLSPAQSALLSGRCLNKRREALGSASGDRMNEMGAGKSGLCSFGVLHQACATVRCWPHHVLSII